MQHHQSSKHRPLTGRIQAGPSEVWHEEVLEKQFDYELQNLLRWYILIEKVLLVEYRRMGLVEERAAGRIGSLLHQITPATLFADPQANMSDIAFALERFIEQSLGESAPPAWHMDRSRNDVQACAQLMFGRHLLFESVKSLFDFVQAIHQLADNSTHLVMLGHTHYQSAQVISPGFYLAALAEHVIGTLRRLLAVYDEMNNCPLGAGAMAGLQLTWDRQRMAHLLGFRGPLCHALMAVASREWQLQIAGELSTFGVGLSRFVTDFLHWGSSEYRFISLPDDLAGISSAMPQKKNFPILERIRGKTAHISSFYIDCLMGQRNTPYTNLVEVSKEAGSSLLTLFTTLQSAVRLFITVIEHVQFQEECMRDVCEREYVGGFALANYLTLHKNIPHRQAQVIAGHYIVNAMKERLHPCQADSTLLASVCRYHGYEINLSEDVLLDAFSADGNLRGKRSAGSTHPDAVHEMLIQQREQLAHLHTGWHQRQRDVEYAFQALEALMSPGEGAV